MDMAVAWREHVVHVMHTQDGAKIAMYCLAFSPPKVHFLFPLFLFFFRMLFTHYISPFSRCFHFFFLFLCF